MDNTSGIKCNSFPYLILFILSQKVAIDFFFLVLKKKLEKVCFKNMSQFDLTRNLIDP